MMAFRENHFGVEAISPRFGGGSGLKPLRSYKTDHPSQAISPRFGGGSGLKPRPAGFPAR